MSAQKVALVTGASRNIGRSIALALARRGYTLACFGRDATALDETAQLIRALGGQASVFVGDAKSNESLNDFADHAVRMHGGIDAVINNAGIALERRSEELTPGEFAEILQVNLVSQFALARAAYAPLRARGGGVSSTSVLSPAPLPFPGWPPTAHPKLEAMASHGRWPMTGPRTTSEYSA